MRIDLCLTRKAFTNFLISNMDRKFHINEKYDPIKYFVRENYPFFIFNFYPNSYTVFNLKYSIHITNPKWLDAFKKALIRRNKKAIYGNQCLDILYPLRSKRPHMKGND